ncbi:M60 family metallopeptidase [Paenibacillus lautus]|uniref:M60 family metallopeptidase n=2 Tax=Paenibacillus TaxID=44249 RepID=UPI002176A8EA|nr:M60 family metallopeptidase [Paenibacillus lautus]
MKRKQFVSRCYYEIIGKGVERLMGFHTKKWLKLLLAVACTLAAVPPSGKTLMAADGMTEQADVHALGTNTAASLATQHDLDVIYKDLSGYPTVSATYNGGVAAIGDQAFVLAVNPDTTPILAAARYGKGKVVVAGDDSYFKFTSDITDERKTVARNILLWLTEDSETLTYREALEGKGRLPMLSATWKNYIIETDVPIDLVRLDQFTEEHLDPSRYPVAYIDGTLKDSEVDAVEHYVAQGGHVVVPLKGWVMEQYPHVFLGNEYQGRSGRLSEDFPVQRLLNRMGLGLMNNTASTRTETLPTLTPEQSANYHSLKLLEQAEAIEAGTLSPDQVNVGRPGAGADKKLQVIASVTGGTVSSISPQSPLYAVIEQDASDLESQLTFPLDRSKAPYTSALLAFQLGRIGNDLTAPKSPYADQFPGTVPGDAPRVSGQSVHVNFDYSTFDYLRQGTVPKNWISTGLYAPAGEWVTIHVPEGTQNLDVQVGAHTDNLTSKTEWERPPVITQRKPLLPGENRIRSPYGGLIYLIPTKPQPGVAKDIEISGGVRAPYYILGETSSAEWEDTIRHHPAPWAELQGRRVILTLPSEYIRQLEDPQQLVEKWDAIVDYTEEVAGLSPDQPLPHKSIDLPFRYVADRQISAGYMHAGYPIMFHIDPSAGHAVDISRVTQGGWGFWHETGHEYQQGAWNWNVTGEITVNIYSLYVQEKFGNSSNLLIRNADGKDFYDLAFEYIESDLPGKSFGTSGQLDLFGYLVMFRQLSLAYGWDFYAELHQAYRELPASQLPATNQEEIDTFVIMASKTAGENLTEFFDKWALPYSKAEVQSRIAALNLPLPSQELWRLRETHSLNAPPEIKVDQDSEWSRESVKVTITMTPEAEAAGMRNQYKMDSNGKWTDYTAPIIVETEGQTTIYARAAALSGVTSNEAIKTVKIDRSGPEITTNVTQSVYQTERFTMSPHITDALSGVSAVIVELDDKEAAETLVIEPLTLTAGPHILRITAEDAAGNITVREYPFEVAVDLEQLDDIVRAGEEKGWIDNHGITQSLLAKIANLQQHSPGSVAAEDAITSLENAIKAQQGKHLDFGFAELLLGDIDYIRSRSSAS